MAPSLPPIRPEDEAVAAKVRPHGAFDPTGVEPHLAARFDYLLRLGDDSLILGQRLLMSQSGASALRPDANIRGEANVR